MLRFLLFDYHRSFLSSFYAWRDQVYVIVFVTTLIARMMSERFLIVYVLVGMCQNVSGF
ncbi:hypothetical protein A21D_00693 [Virgibacillus dokdonensis]|uniref:Uncharacterized protein n=1 Tax=Virgibacillus dokdonensis TaxID=302167 RepID=A0A2K9IVM4_9BACI|nr:hypothetical protein A21D_00693 [Virgibacillus dokdonensis]